MYQGKYLQENRKESSDAQKSVSRENTPPVVPAGTVPERTPSTRTTAPNASPRRQRRRNSRRSGKLFYSLYFLFILVVLIATFAGLNWLRGWLTDYEAAQPTVKAEQIFHQLFSDPQWDQLYEASGALDSVFEGKEQFISYMNNKISSAELTYLETSAGLSGDKKYVVRLGDEKIASFTLVDKNSDSGAGTDNMGTLPDWQLGTVEVFFARNHSYLIEKKDGHTAYVNGVPLDDSYTIQIATTKAEEYLPEGTAGISMCIQQINGLVTLPTVTVFDENGSQMEVTYDESTCTFTERTESNTISIDEEEVAVDAAKTYCLWMIKEITSKATVAKYFDSSCDTYRSIVNTTELWMQSHNGYEFTDISITGYCHYTDDLFSARVSMNLNVTRTDDTTKTYPYLQSLIFKKNDSGKWLCIKATNVDISQPVGIVRLTFMQGETQLSTGFYNTDVTEIVTPTVSPVPEGQIFSGWVTITEDETGNTVYTLVFQPDETGRVTIPEGTTLMPMTLYALFEDAEAASANTGTTEGA